MKYAALMIATLAAAACAGSKASPSASPATAAASVTDLRKLLASETMDDGGIRAYENRVGGVFMDHVGEVAEDTEAPLLARVHALELIAINESARQFGPVRTALHDADPRVRATALATANTLRLAGHKSYTRLVREALEDPAPELQAKALQFVGDEDIVDLRRIAASDRPATVLSVANGLLQALEERGAPLVPDANGALTRTGASGHTMRFVPERAWSQWDAAVGRVTIRTADNRKIELPAQIEAVANVVPVFFSATGEHVVYEADRRIHVMEIASGTTRDVGPGISPRIRPFTDGFVFLRPDPTGPVSDRGVTQLSYNILNAPFTGAASPDVLGSLNVTMTQNERGNYSPARWMNVVETDGAFFLATGDTVLFRLPSPFGATPN